MTSPATQASTILVSKSVGVQGGSAGNWPIFIGGLPTEPHALIALMDTPGQNANPAYLLDYPTIQALVRGAIDDYDGAFTKCKQVKDALLGIDPIVIDGDRWDGVTSLGDMAYLKRDDSSRPIWVANFRIFLEPATNALTSRAPL